MPPLVYKDPPHYCVTLHTFCSRGRQTPGQVILTNSVRVWKAQVFRFFLPGGGFCEVWKKKKWESCTEGRDRKCCYVSSTSSPCWSNLVLQADYKACVLVKWSSMKWSLWWILFIIVIIWILSAGTDRPLLFPPFSTGLGTGSRFTEDFWTPAFIFLSKLGFCFYRRRSSFLV